MGFSIGDAFRKVGDAFKQAARDVRDDVVNTVVDKVTSTVGKAVDKYEPQLYRAAQAIDGLIGLVRGRGPNPDKQYDGALVGANGATHPAGTSLNDVVGTRPSNGSAPNERILYVNGIATPLATQQQTMQAIADKTGAEVIGIHNSTEGFITDLRQSAGDKVDKGKNAAVDSMSETIYQELQAGNPVHIMAHSQGALVTSRALTDVKNRLMIEDGLTLEQAEQKLSTIKVETFGGASDEFTDGPQYVHYINRGDPVPTMLGLGAGERRDSQPGRDAVVRYFNDFSLNIVKAHNIDTTYLNQRVPFDDARAGN